MHMTRLSIKDIEFVWSISEYHSTEAANQNFPSIDSEQLKKWNTARELSNQIHFSDSQNPVYPPKNMSVPTDDPLLSVIEQDYSMNSNVDPKNMQELTIYVSKGDFCESAQFFYTNWLISGPEPAAKRPGQVPDDVRPDHLPDWRHG